MQWLVGAFAIKGSSIPFPREMTLMLATTVAIWYALPVALAAIRPWRSKAQVALFVSALIARLAAVHVPNNFYSDLPVPGSYRFNYEYQSTFYEALWSLLPSPTLLLYANIACGVLAVLLIYATALKLSWFESSAFWIALTVAVAPFFVRLTAGYEVHPFGLLSFTLCAWRCVSVAGSLASRRDRTIDRVVNGLLAYLIVATRFEFLSMGAVLLALVFARRRIASGGRVWRDFAIDACIVAAGAFGGLALSPAALGPSNAAFDPSTLTAMNVVRHLPWHLSSWRVLSDVLWAHQQTGLQKPLVLLPLSVPIGLVALALFVWKRPLRVFMYVGLMLAIAMPYGVVVSFSDGYSESLSDWCMGRYALLWAVVPVAFSWMGLFELLPRGRQWIPGLVLVAGLVPCLPAYRSLTTFQSEFVFLQEHRELLRDKCLVVGWEKNAGRDLTEALSFPNAALFDVVEPDRLFVFSDTGALTQTALRRGCELVLFENLLSSTQAPTPSWGADPTLRAETDAALRGFQQTAERLRESKPPLAEASLVTNPALAPWPIHLALFPVREEQLKTVLVAGSK